MKKLLLLTAAFALSIFSGAQAQITFLHTDFPGIGNVIIYGNDTTNTGSISIGSAGADQDWDFTGLSNDEQDTSIFSHPDWQSLGNNFPNSNLVLLQSGGTQVYLNINAAFIAIQGFGGDLTGSGDEIAIPFDPVGTFIDFPVDYQNVNLDTSGFEVQIESPQPPADSIRIKSRSYAQREVDAWGDVMLSTGTYNALRIKTEETVIDSTWAKIAGVGWTLVDNNMEDNRSYAWLAQGIGQLVDISTDLSDNVESATFMVQEPAMTSIEEASMLQAETYPNPAAEFITVEGDFEMGATLMIYSLNGQLAKSTRLDGNRTQVDLSDLPAGAYGYRVLDTNFSTIASGKFLVR